MWQRYWIAFLGIFFIFLSGLYFLKLAFDGGLIPPTGIVAIGLIAGLSGLIGGYSLHHRQKPQLAEVVAGIGTGMIYATLAYAGFSEQVNWTFTTVLMAMMATTGFVAWIGHRYHMRILTNLSLIAGLLTPFVLRAPVEQVTLLFWFVLTLNVAALVFSVIKPWRELRVFGFALTVGLYFSYYIFFEPNGWIEPFRYIFSIFIVYAVGLILASWQDKDQFAGLNLYLGLVNAINFVFWAYFIFNDANLNAAFPILLVGLVFIGTAALIQSIAHDAKLPILAYFFLGIILCGIGGSELSTMFTTTGVDHVVRFSVWLMLGILIYTVGLNQKVQVLAIFGTMIWVYIFGYWYKVAWDVEWVRWFGVDYIPFINPEALLWIGLALSGFFIARTISRFNQSPDDKTTVKLFEAVTLGYSLLSHLVIGGLLTIQIENTWKAYQIHILQMDLVISTAWGIYAALLFVWGSYTRSRVFRWFGSVVLVIVAAKALLVDLSGQETMYKALFLMVLGFIMLGIFWINNRWALQEMSNHLPPTDESVPHPNPTDNMCKEAASC